MLLFSDTGCHLEDLPRVMTNTDRWQERESKESVQSAYLDDGEDDDNNM